MEWNANNTKQAVYLWKGPNKTKQPRTLQAATTGAPLPHGDALVAYENLRWEKNSEGNENGEKKFDINVCRPWYNGMLRVCKASETRTSCPHWHRMVVVECDSGKGVSDFVMARSVC